MNYLKKVIAQLDNNPKWQAIIDQYTTNGVTDWDAISFSQELENLRPHKSGWDFLKKYKDKINWDSGISGFWVFPDSFLKEMEDYINWEERDKEFDVPKWRETEEFVHEGEFGVVYESDDGDEPYAKVSMSDESMEIEISPAIGEKSTILNVDWRNVGELSMFILNYSKKWGQYKDSDKFENWLLQNEESLFEQLEA